VGPSGYGGTVRLKRVALLAALAAALGCGRAAGDGDAIQLWALGHEGTAATKLVAEFERTHPGTRVRVQQIPWSAAHEKILTAYAGSALPDVFQVGNTWIPELVALGAIERLDDRLAASPGVARDDYFPGVWETNVVEGGTYGVPWYVDTRLLFYRTDLLMAVGAREFPRTWTAWTAVMERIRQPGRWPIFLPATEWQTPVVLALQLGGALLRDGDTRGNFRSEPVRRAFTFYVDLFRRGLAPRGADAVVANVWQEFGRGYFAFWPSGPWNLAEMDARLPPDAKDRWSTAPFPAPDGGTWPGASLAGGASLVVARGSPRADAAWRLVEWLSDPAQQARFWELAGDLPARRTPWHRAVLRASPKAEAFWVQLQAVRPTPRIPEWERIAAAVGRWSERMIREDVAVDPGLEALDREVDEVLEKRRWLERRTD